MVSVSVILQLFWRREPSGKLRNKATNSHLPRRTYQFKPQYFWKQFLQPPTPPSSCSACFQSCSLSPDSFSSEKFSVSLIDCQKVTVWAGCGLVPQCLGNRDRTHLWVWGHLALHSECQVCQVSQVSQCYIVRPCLKKTQKPKPKNTQKTKVHAVARFAI